MASVVACNVASSWKPLYNQYDPALLERLQYDDKLAETAASAAQQGQRARPAYCDSRYYRAVANGGQGC